MIDDNTQTDPPPSRRRVATLTTSAAILLWMAQPPMALWPLAMIALLPLLPLVTQRTPLSRREYLTIWMVMTVYWLVTLQGLRHAHWAMYFCWMALAAYLAVFPIWFVVAARWLFDRRCPLFLAVAVAWTISPG